MLLTIKYTESEVSSILQKKVLSFKLEFSSEEKITSYAGLGLYGEMYRAVGIHHEVARLLPKPQ